MTVPAEVVDVISRNSYVGFKFLLPGNLAVTAFCFFASGFSAKYVS